MESRREQEHIYDFFRIGVAFKAAQSVVELIISAVLFLIPLSAIVHLADLFTEAELGRDPDDFIANSLVNFAHSISIGSKEYAAIYLLLHASTKLFLAIMLLKNKVWAYPVALGVLSVLVTYQWYRIFLHHSILLTCMTIIDCFVVYFIWREYRIVRERAAIAQKV